MSIVCAQGRLKLWCPFLRSQFEKLWCPSQYFIISFISKFKFIFIFDITICTPNVKQVKIKVKYLYLYWISLWATWVVLLGGPVMATPFWSSVTKVGNRSTRRKPAMLGRVRLDNTLLTWDQGNFNQIAARSRNRILVTVARDICTATVPPAPPKWTYGQLFLPCLLLFPTDSALAVLVHCIYFVVVIFSPKIY